MLQAADLCFGYGRRDDEAGLVLRGVSLEIPPGAFVGILGPNGSGKTTLLKLLAGTLRPSRGGVTLDGRDLAATPRGALARRMAVVPQETHLAFDYTVLEVVLMGRYTHLGPFEIEGPGDVAVAREALAATGTLDFQDRVFTTLSGGEKQRVVIASALAQLDAPRTEREGESILLLDEPTAALDLAYQLDLATLLARLQARFPITVVISTHDLSFASSVCRTLVLLKQGRTLANGAVEDVLNPENVRALYGVDADVQRHPSGRTVIVPIRRAALPVEP